MRDYRAGLRAAGSSFFAGAAQPVITAAALRTALRIMNVRRPMPAGISAGFRSLAGKHAVSSFRVSNAM
jgi:hypothetical protein